MLIPKGSPAELVVLEAREKSGWKGPRVQLGLRSVTVKGVNYMVVSNELEQTAGIGKNRRPAEMVGGGATLGTMIGAAAGGGKGAVLGGLAGAAAGAAIQIFTQGDEVRIPSETVMTFRIDEPIRLQKTP
jgi:outer membrane lipoprotein SlyB